MADFQQRAILVIATPILEVGGHEIFSECTCRARITIPGFETVAITALKLCMIESKNSATV